MSTDLAVALYNQLERMTAARCLEKLNPGKSAEIIEKLDPIVALVFLRGVKKNERNSILNAIPQKTASLLNRMLSFPEDSAGALADPTVFTLTEDASAKQALARIGKQPEHSIFYLYVVNRDHKLVGVMNMRELLLLDPEEKILAVMKSSVTQLAAHLDFQEILNHPGWQDYHVLPVVDATGIFTGVIRYKTLKRIERESRKNVPPRLEIAAGNALGDLFRIGFSGLLRSATLKSKDQIGEMKK